MKQIGQSCLLIVAFSWGCANEPEPMECSAFTDETTRPDEHRQAFRCLLYFTPEASRQIPYLSAVAPQE